MLCKVEVDWEEDGRRLAAGNLLDGDSSLVFNEEDGLGFKSRRARKALIVTLKVGRYGEQLNFLAVNFLL